MITSMKGCAQKAFSQFKHSKPTKPHHSLCAKMHTTEVWPEDAADCAIDQQSGPMTNNTEKNCLQQVCGTP